MKPKNNSKNKKGQIQAKGKSGTKKMPNINSIQQKQNFKNNNKINPVYMNQNSQKKNLSNNKKMMMNNNINNNIINNMKNQVLSKSVKRINNINKKISPPKQIKMKDYQFIEFHPYTLKDYKEMIRNPVVMGPLGANIGTKEWEEKKNKMKKMMNYSNNINREHKGINKLKKDTPKDEREKLTKEKIEKSARHRTYEYGKLLRTGKYKEDFDEKEYNYLNNSKENKLDVIQENEMNNFNNEESNNMNNINNIEQENEMSYDQLVKQNEEFESNIKDIREHILD